VKNKQKLYNMKKDLQKKLARYTAAAAGIVGATTATGQIVFTNITPDYTSTGNNALPLDLNNDSVTDYVIMGIDTLISGTQYSLTVVAPDGTAGNEIGGSAPSGYNYALALNSGNMVDNTVNWISATNTMSYEAAGAFPYNENWNGVTDKYLALRFNAGGSQYYGWARMDVEGDDWTLKSYAYNDSAGVGLYTGDMGNGVTGLEDLDVSELVHFINRANNTVEVIINGDLNDGNITLTSISGQNISVKAINSKIETVDLNGLASGLYMLNVKFNEGSITKKIFVK
jgi:hypothetical protein